MSSENLIKDQGIFTRVIILLILTTYLFTDVWILLGENSVCLVATDERKQSQCLNIVINNKTGPLFLAFN